MKTCIIINSDNFPYGLASVEKIKLLSRGLEENGYRVIVINMFSNINPLEYTVHKSIGRYKNTTYIYTSGRPFAVTKPHKLLLIPITLIKEISLFKRLFANSSDKSIIIQYTHLIFVIWYFLLSKLLGLRMFINTMEYHGLVKKSLKGFLFDKYSCKFSNGVIVISHFLKEMTIKNCRNKKVLTLPATVNFELFEKRKPNIQNYSLFCASASYYNTFEFIVKSFEKLKNVSEHELVLVANGSSSKLEKIYCLVNSSKKSNLIKVKSSVKYEYLVEMYCNASVLLIPLFDNLRDKARFPHKIGEYTASRRPILTTNVGEIPYYFEDMKSAFIVDRIDEEPFGEKWNYILNDNELADNVGINGYYVGLEYFDYQKQGKKLAEFIR